MSKLKETLEELRQRVDDAEIDAEEVLGLVSKLERELEVRRLDQVVSRVKWKLEEAQKMRWNLSEVRLLLNYRGEVDLIPPSEKSSLVYSLGITLEEFLQVLKKTADSVRGNVDSY